MENELFRLKQKLDSLTVYRSLIEDPLLSSFCSLVDTLHEGGDENLFFSRYGEFFYRIAPILSRSSFAEYLASLVVYSDNAYARECEIKPLDEIDPVLVKAAVRDLLILRQAAFTSSREILKTALRLFAGNASACSSIEELPCWDNLAIRERISEAVIDAIIQSEPTETAALLARYHRANGCGIFARYRGFVWKSGGENGRLEGIERTDPVRLSDLTGYELERQKVIENTLSLLDGWTANNILLYGDSGTGKSSTVKAILNEYADRGLRMIELSAGAIAEYPYLLRKIAGQNKKFILFIDDLAFEDSESHYTALKAMLEGSLESRPQNVVIYATSNRRHLIKEKHSDRAALYYGNSESDEIHARDAIQEKQSLSERFGITVTFLSPDKEKFLSIIDHLADQRGLAIDRDTLHREALIWESWQNGRTPRTARQFIDWLQGRLARDQ